MAIRFVKFPEVENAKERSILEFAWLERQQNEELKKNQQNYINFGALPDEIIKPAVLWVYYKGLSVLPSSRHVYFQQITAENEDGEIETVALQPKIQYAGEIHLAVHGENARYNAVEMLIDNKRLGAETLDDTPFDLNSLLTIRVIDKAGQARSLSKSIKDCLLHGLEHSPTISKFKGDLNKFWKGYQDYKAGNQSLFNPWYANPITMSAKHVWRRLDNQDAITTYSEEYLEEVRETAIASQMLPEVTVDMSGTKAIPASAPVALIEESVTVIDGEVVEEGIVIAGEEIICDDDIEI